MPLIQTHSVHVHATHQTQVLGWVKEGVRDCSISRAAVAWGIPIARDPSQTVYVWFDALNGYLSALYEVRMVSHSCIMAVRFTVCALRTNVYMHRCAPISMYACTLRTNLYIYSIYVYTHVYVHRSKTPQPWTALSPRAGQPMCTSSARTFCAFMPSTGRRC